MVAILHMTFSNAFYWMKTKHNFLELRSSEFNWQWNSIGSDKGIAPNRQQVIIWTSDGPVYWCIYVSLCLHWLRAWKKLHTSCSPVHLKSFLSVWLVMVIYAVTLLQAKIDFFTKVDTVESKRYTMYTCENRTGFHRYYIALGVLWMKALRKYLDSGCWCFVSGFVDFIFL